MRKEGDGMYRMEMDVDCGFGDVVNGYFGGYCLYNFRDSGQHELQGFIPRVHRTDGVHYLGKRRSGSCFIGA